jgi:DNA-binding response OmpR family regulator
LALFGKISGHPLVALSPFCSDTITARKTPNAATGAANRLGKKAPTAVLRRGELTLDRPRRQASRNGQLVPLTRKELGVLQVLMSADGAVISAEELLERVWDEHADPFTNAVTVTVMRLRRKLGEPPLIETVTGEGYRLP